MKPLTPAQQQALEQFLYGILISALLAALSAIMPYVSSDTVNWRFVGIVGGVAFLASLGHSVAVYLRAIQTPNVKSTDLVSVADLLDLLADGLSKRYATRPISTPTESVGPVTTSVYPVVPMDVPQHLASLSDIPDVATAKRPTV